MFWNQQFKTLSSSVWLVFFDGPELRVVLLWPRSFPCYKQLYSRDGNRSGRPAPVGLPVGSRFFDRPVKPVEKPVKLSFFGTKKHLSTKQSILTYFIINKTFYKKSVLTNHTFRKHLLNGFKLCPLRHAHPGTFLEWEYCAVPPILDHGTKQKSAKYTLKSRNQILIKHA